MNVTNFECQVFLFTGNGNSWNHIIHKLKWIYFRPVLAILNHCGPPPELQLFFFKRIMTLHQGNSCSLFQNGHQVIKKARWPCHQMTSCKLMCYYCCYLRDLFGWIIFQGKKTAHGNCSLGNGRLVYFKLSRKRNIFEFDKWN